MWRTGLSLRLFLVHARLYPGLPRPPRTRRSRCYVTSRLLTEWRGRPAWIRLGAPRESLRDDFGRAFEPIQSRAPAAAALISPPATAAKSRWQVAQRRRVEPRLHFVKARHRRLSRVEGAPSKRTRRGRGPPQTQQAPRSSPWAPSVAPGRSPPRKRVFHWPDRGKRDGRPVANRFQRGFGTSSSGRQQLTAVARRGARHARQARPTPLPRVKRNRISRPDRRVMRGHTAHSARSRRCGRHSDIARARRFLNSCRGFGPSQSGGGDPKPTRRPIVRLQRLVA